MNFYDGAEFQSRFKDPDYGLKYSIWYDPNGNKYLGTYEEVMKAMDKDMKNKIVKQETLPNGYWVSTVWLGLDHGLMFADKPKDYKPLIYETMVFSAKGASDLDMERYSTREQAEKGHKEMVEKWRNK